jgi:hypothetical protein
MVPLWTQFFLSFVILFRNRNVFFFKLNSNDAHNKQLENYHVKTDNGFSRFEIRVEILKRTDSETLKETKTIE